MKHFSLRRSWLSAEPATFLVLGLVAAAAIVAAGRYAQRESAVAASRTDVALSVTRVARMRPAEGSRDVLPNTSVALDLAFPRNDGAATGVDPRTIERGVRLLDSEGHIVDAHVNTSGAGDTIVLVPRAPLRAGATFTLQTNDALLDTDGKPVSPYSSSFGVSASAHSSPFPIGFEKMSLDADSGSAFTAIVMGPDSRLYAATFDGRILQYDVRPDGTLSLRETIDAVTRANHGPRMIIGLAFDPRAWKSAPRLWVSHGQLVPMFDGTIRGADDWTGKISTIEGEHFSTYHDRVVGLPRAYKDHLNFQPSFGPDGALYFGQGSQTGTGAPDTKWGMRPERMLSAAILRLDVDWLPLDRPLDVRTVDGGGNYDPNSGRAALRIFASGVRCAYDVLWHSSGRLYAPINGASAGGSTPGVPPRDGRPGVAAINSLDQVTDDVLIEVVPDIRWSPLLALSVNNKHGTPPVNGYYGAPNPARGEYILNGGNPTAAVDPYEVGQYPVGTMPEANWRPPVFDFGKNISPNGMIEYAAAGPLQHAILVTRYSGGDDIVALLTDDAGRVTSEVTGIGGFTGFTDPLDLTQDSRTGNIYVAEFGGRRLTLLRPVANAKSAVYIRAAN